MAVFFTARDRIGRPRKRILASPDQDALCPLAFPMSLNRSGLRGETSLVRPISDSEVRTQDRKAQGKEPNLADVDDALPARGWPFIACSRTEAKQSSSDGHLYSITARRFSSRG